MCSVTLVPFDDGFSLACNRDERRDRPPAIPPSIHRLTRRRAVYPVDPVAGGSWIGINDVGLTVALLNRTIVPNLPTDTRLSRGLIVPSLLDRSSLAEALDAANALDVARFNLFRLLLVHGRHGAILSSNGHALALEQIDVTAPHLLTSSSLGDQVVDEPRRRLFERLVINGPPSLCAQHRFHCHQWPDRRDLSVLMERTDARTVSQSFVTVSSGLKRFRYLPVKASSAAAVEAA